MASFFDVEIPDDVYHELQCRFGPDLQRNHIIAYLLGEVLRLRDEAKRCRHCKEPGTDSTCRCWDDT